MEYLLVHHWTVTKSPHIILEVLHSSWCHYCHLPRIKAWQALSHVHAIETCQRPVARVFGAENYEAVTNIAAVLEVNWEVYDIKLPSEVWFSCLTNISRLYLFGKLRSTTVVCSLQVQ